MLIPDSVRKCVVYVGLQTYDEKYKIFGTAFFLTRDDGRNAKRTYLVTARHVLDEIINVAVTNPVEIWLWVRFQNNETNWIKTMADKWVSHPDKSVDVAVLGVSDFEDFNHKSYPLHNCLAPNDLDLMNMGVGHEVFITGLFSKHTGKQNMIPIVRVGNLAAMPEERINTIFHRDGIEGYLIEARSTGGLSGSPVFIPMEYSQRLEKSFLIEIERLERTLKDETLPDSEEEITPHSLYLLGLIHAHFDEEEIDNSGKVGKINTGIAVVVPASKILEVLEQAMIKEQKQPELDEIGDTVIEEDANDDEMTRERFFSILKKISRPDKQDIDEEKLK